MSWVQKLKGLIYNSLVKLLENALSKKMLVFITATVLLAKDILPAMEWTSIALAILGVATALDFKNGQRDLSKEHQPPAEEPLEIP